LSAGLSAGAALGVGGPNETSSEVMYVWSPTLPPSSGGDE
jgi:hypothetical protein